MEVKNIQEQKTLCIRLITSIGKIPQDIDKSYCEIWDYIKKIGAKCGGDGPYAKYYNEDMANLDAEFGFIVDKDYEAEGNVKAGKLAGGKYLVEVHKGPYTTLEETYNKMMEELKEKGYEMDVTCEYGYCFEIYLNDPDETELEELETEIYFKLK